MRLFLFQHKALFQSLFYIAAGSSESLCGNKIGNILVEYEGLVHSDLETEGEFDSSDSRTSHIDDTALGEVMVSKTDINVEGKRNGMF
jgi:hypothetical protein